MKKVVCTVIYRKNTNQIYNITVNHQGSITPLVRYSETDNPSPYKYQSFKAMFDSVLAILKNNNMCVGKYERFSAIWYDIQWIDLENPYTINKYAYAKNK